MIPLLQRGSQELGRDWLGEGGISFLLPISAHLGCRIRGTHYPQARALGWGEYQSLFSTHPPSWVAGRPAWPIIGSIHACNEMEMRPPDRGSIELGRMTASFRAWRGSPPLSPACSFTAPLCPPSPEALLCPLLPFTLDPGLLPSQHSLWHGCFQSGPTFIMSAVCEDTH